MEYIKFLIFNKSFLLGILFSIAVFSKYIFGANNILEEFVELIYKIRFNKDINFSPEVPEDPEKDLNRLWDNIENNSHQKNPTDNVKIITPQNTKQNNKGNKNNDSVVRTNRNN